MLSFKEALSSPVTVALPPRKSAGLAWLLSVIIPGTGHFYVALYLRAGLVFGFSVLGMFVFVSSLASGGSGSATLADSLVVALPILWCFGFLDAYFSTIERNRGIDPTVVDNPRVAAVLNLTTRGFGYFYLGERAKGVALFVLMSVLALAAAASTGLLAALLTVIVTTATIWISVDAYRVGRRSFVSQVASMELPPAPAPSRLPPVIPFLLGGITALTLVVLFVSGTVVLLMNGPAQP